MAVSTRLRWEILRRDQFACRYCGARANDGAVLEIDHVLPKILGGKDKADNLVAACEACNSGKGSTHPDSPLIEDVEEEALWWARVARCAGQKMIADRGALADLLSEFEEAWGRWGYGKGEERQPVPISEDWQRTVSRLLLNGLPMPVLLDCIQDAMAQGKRPAQALFGDTCQLAQSKLVQIGRLAEGVVRAGEAEPNFAALSVPAFAESLLDHLDDDEREAALSETREEYNKDIEAVTAETVFGNLVIERWRLQESIKRILECYPDDEVAAARECATAEHIHYMGEAPESSVAAQSAEIVAAYFEARRYIEGLPEDEGAAWLTYVDRWPSKEPGAQAVMIRAADVARRNKAGEPSLLMGMCAAPVPDSSIDRCLEPATHAVWVEDCKYCIKAGRSECAGEHYVCEPHLGDLIDDKIVRASTGESIKVRDFAELAVSA
jgi:hypothetical protein